jgi:hypothetical protein
MKFINESLLEVGTKFTVSDQIKEVNLSPGSIGFISSVGGTHEDFQNVARVTVMLTRKGKAGKPRIERIEMISPIFYYYENEENFKKIMPAAGSNNWYGVLERIDGPVENLIKMQTLDFLGWASAVVYNLRGMLGKIRHGWWPEDQGNPLNRFARMSEMFNEDPDKFLELYQPEKVRRETIEAIRRMEGTLFKLRLMQNAKRLQSIANAAEFLTFVNNGEFIAEDAEDKKNEYRFTEDTALLAGNVEYHAERLKEIGEVCKKNKVAI